MPTPLPPPKDFSQASRQFLNGIYEGYFAESPQEKVGVLREYLIESEMLVTAHEGDESIESELRGLEYFVLLEKGFHE